MTKLNYQSRPAAKARVSTGGEATLQEFLPSLVLMGIGAILILIYYLNHLDGRSTVVAMGIVAAIMLVQVVLGIGVAFAVAMLIGSSFGELRSAGVKLAGILFFCAGIDVWLPMGWLVVLFVYLGLLMWMFGLQVYEAVIFAIIFTVVRLIVLFAMIGLLA